MTVLPLAIFASGAGSNFDAICDYFRKRTSEQVSAGPAISVRTVVLISNNAASAALAKAHTNGVEGVLLRRHDDADEIIAALERCDTQLIALAGYLKRIPTPVVRRYEDRILNVHPSLLPLFGGEGMYGMRVHQAVLDSGCSRTGVTVHLVSEDYDRGAILAQCPVPVREGDSAALLARRVLEVEHIVYPRVIEAFARGSISAAKPCFIPDGQQPQDIMKTLERML